MNEYKDFEEMEVWQDAQDLAVELIYYEACLDEKDAFKREKYLKTTYGKRFIRSRCKNYLTGWRNPVE
jgi:putative endonuclease